MLHILSCFANLADLRLACANQLCQIDTVNGESISNRQLQQLYSYTLEAWRHSSSTTSKVICR